MAGEEKIPVGVIGVGYLGKFQEEKYARSPKAKLVAVADIDGVRAREVADSLGVDAVTDYRELLGHVRGVSVAVPTRLHYDIAGELLRGGIDVLVEKPMTATIEEGRRLVSLARENGRMLQ